MLEKKITVRTAVQLLLLVLVLAGMAAAEANSVKTAQYSRATDGPVITRRDSIEKKAAEIENELEEIVRDNRLCMIIGAYTILNQGQPSKPTLENVAALVSVCNCWYPDLILAQYQLESGSGTSAIAHKNNNLFGMKKAFTRKSVRCRTFDKAGYAVYNSWQLSVIDRIYWEEHAFKGKKPSRDEYINMICKTYAEDSGYRKKLVASSERYLFLLNTPYNEEE